MDSIDRLGWAAGISFTSHGVRLGVRTNDPAVRGRLRNYLPPGWKPSRSPLVDDLYSLFVGETDSAAAASWVRRYNLLYVGASRMARTLDLDEALEALETYLHINVAFAARSHVFVHAGVVGWCGRAIVMPGPAKSGKSRLVAALVRAGATYYSDTYAVFDARGRVLPFAKPLSLRRASGERPERVPVESLGGRAGTEPLPVGLIAAVDGYRPGARWRPRPLSAGESVMKLLEHTIPSRYVPAVALETLQRAVDAEGGGVRALRGARGESEGAAVALLEHLGAGPTWPAPDN